jgi:putative ABC transport system permease protein
MTSWTLILRGLRFHARSHLGVLFGAAVGSAVLIGALAVGDSVRWSLREFALARLGKTDLALTSNDRFFRTHLANDLQAHLPAIVAPALEFIGTASRSDGAARANRVQVLGVDERFWQLSPKPPVSPNLDTNSVFLNSHLASQLSARPGDAILLRVPKPSLLPRDAPISPQEDTSAALRLTVRAILSDAELGRFSLQANQVAPFSAFVSLARLQNQLNVSNRANLILAGGAAGNDGTRSSLSLSNVTTALSQDWQLADAQLELRPLPAMNSWELRSGRVFLDTPVCDAALRANTNAHGILTYFVNELRVGQRTTPYSMVTAMGDPVVPPDMKDDEILLNQWLADDLQAKPGDALQLHYFVVGVMRHLEERQQSFRVHAILPMQGASADRELMPDFPGLAKADNCRDWDAGFPIRLDSIRPKDEKYWHDFRGTPKAFVTLAAGQRMWSNRFGNLTAIRFPMSGVSSNQLDQLLRQALNPAELGLSFEPVRAQAVAASEQAQDFGQLFLGFSFFLIVAALLLMALLFQFQTEQRIPEIATLLALGFPPKRVRLLWLGEAGAVALLGAVLGVIGGVGYARAMLYGLSTIWRQAVGTSALHYHAEAATLALGAGIGAAVSLLTIWLALRKQARRSAHELLTSGADAESSGTAAPGQRSWATWVAALAILGGCSLLGYGLMKPEGAAEVFFGAGALWLIGGLAVASLLIRRLATSNAAAHLTVSGMGIRNATRRRKRSLATVNLLACGCFLIVAVGANRLDSTRDAEKRDSGTGGFALIGESALPIVQDLDTPAGRDFYGLDAKALAEVSIVPMRVHEGDDASCLNLNRAQTPRLLGVRPELLQNRQAFTFAQIANGLSRDKGWLLLGKDPNKASGTRKPGDISGLADGKTPDRPKPAAGDSDDDTVPAIGDEASILWALGKKVGDTLSYTDEHGRPFKVRLVGALANSILQGSLVIAEDQFIARFPSESGYRMFLIDAPPRQAGVVAETLSRGLQDNGLELIAAAQRLAAFNAVQNTYLSTFQALGGLGLLLGSVGLGVVVLRNVLERRGELGLLTAVGYRPRALNWLVLSEHGILLLLGLGVGALAAVIAVLPALLSPGAEVPYRTLALTLAAVFASGALWTWLATRLALRGQLLEALRNE